MSTKLPTIIDNQPGNTLRDSLTRLLKQTNNWDIAIGFFEVGAFVCLGGDWVGAERIRILMGDSYVSDATEGVPCWARRLFNGRVQTPEFNGDGGRVSR